jgi:copper transporter 1
MISRRSSQNDDDDDAAKSAQVDTQEQLQRVPRRSARMIVPFIAAHDIPRGAIYAFQALLSYTLMLAVM